MLKRLFEIDNKWFFTELPPSVKFLSFFVKGDLIVLLPLVIGILLTGFFSIKLMITMLGVYITVRYLGEMIYWFSHQFSDRRYRPSDFGFKKLDNHAIYILHQTLSIAGVTFGIAIVVFSFLSFSN